jgi:trk system potassium uptake protein
VPVDPDWEEGRKLMNTFRHALVFVGTLLGVAFVVCEGVAWLAADATGGFSTRSGSIGAFDNAAVEWILVGFMLIAGLSFVAHYHALTGKPAAYFRSSEIRFFLMVCGVSIGLATALVWSRVGGAFSETLRTVAFQTVSLCSTTGYTTTDYEPWPIAVKLLLLVLMVMGACAGSTSGAIKSIRVVVVAKMLARQFRLLLLPSMVQRIRIDGEVVEEARASEAMAYIVLYLLLLCLLTLVLSLFSPDMLTAASAVIACLGGVGPGMAAAGPVETYAQFPAIAKLVLIFAMLLGRLEIYCCLALFAPSFWKR